jgi:hypothetical protein
MTTTEQELSIAVLKDILEESGEKKAVFAAAITNGDESLLSKKLNGVGGRDFGMRDLMKLDRDLIVQWLKRFGKQVGVEVREVSQAEIAAEFMDLFTKMQAVVRLHQVTTPKPLKAELTAPEQAKRSA